MSLASRLSEYIAAAFTGIWIHSYEHFDALTEIAQLCRERGWSLASWDLEQGLCLGNQSSPEASDPIAALRSLPGLARGDDGSALLVLPNFHRLLNGPEIIQALAQQIHRGKTQRTFVIILAPVVQIPVELEKQFVVLEHDLPDRNQLQTIARQIATEPGELPEGIELDRLLDAAGGLTRFEAEGAFSLSLVRQSTLVPQVIWELKQGMLIKSGLLSLHRGRESFADLGGLEALKGFCTRALSSTSTTARPRGILLLGVPGSGKSAFCKALGNQVNRPTLVLDIGSLMGSLVGLTEERTRQALRIVDAMAPAILFIDELEKALAGASATTDSGVGARLMGTLLSWLNDHTSEVFVVCTANDITRLPPEFSRAERFDAVFFVDLPGSAQKQRIWDIHLSRYGLADVPAKPDAREWTGAEIQSCCRLAALLDLPLDQAARHVVPVAVTAAESMSKLRAFASGRCLDASKGGIYLHEAAAPATSRRVSRPGSN
jgi:hypothetical protein